VHHSLLASQVRHSLVCLAHGRAPRLPSLVHLAAMRKLRIVTLGFGTARQRMVLARATNPKPQRRSRSPRYGVPPCTPKTPLGRNLFSSRVHPPPACWRPRGRAGQRPCTLVASGGGGTTARLRTVLPRAHTASPSPGRAIERVNSRTHVP
jgi:hypothetical protein